MAQITVNAARAFLDGGFRPAALNVRSGKSLDIDLDERFLVLPGMVNAHDHLEFNSFPVLGRQGAYPDMYEWAGEIQSQRNAPEIRAALKIPLEDRLRLGGLKNLLSGVTTVAHHNPWNACFEKQFAVRVLRDCAWSHSLGLDEDIVDTFRRSSRELPWVVHAAEGVSERASREIDDLERLGLIAANTVLVHVLGATRRQLERIVEKSASVISCPVSNLFLYGRTLDFENLPEGLRIALASDSAASGSSGILEDLRMLRSLSGWPEEKIWNMVTGAPSRILRLSPDLADLVVFQDFDPVLVMIDGEVRMTGEELQHLFDEPPQRIRVRGQVKYLSGRIVIPRSSIMRAAEWTPYLREWEC